MKIKLPAIPKMNKTWAVLGAALAFGLLAAVATRSFLSSQVAEIEARGKHQTVDIVVAKTEIAKDSVVTSKNLAVRKIPLEFAHSGAVKPSEFELIDGKVVAYKIDKGEMLMWSQMAGKRVPSFSARLTSGRRAITVMVDEINSISGMLEPGDLIDLMFSLDQDGKKIVIPLLQSMQVMATGQRSVDDVKSGERVQFTTVTLDATPDQAKNIIIARETGKLTALLRNPDDKQAIGNKSYDLAALFGTKLEARHIASRQGIPVLYGGNGAQYPAQALHLGRYRDSGDGQSAPAGPAAPPPPAGRASATSP